MSRVDEIEKAMEVSAYTAYPRQNILYLIWEVQRLRKALEAAKEDMIRIAMHNYTVSKCRACKYDGEDGYGCDLNPAEFDDSECHFMWRGVQEENDNEV